MFQGCLCLSRELNNFCFEGSLFYPFFYFFLELYFFYLGLQWSSVVPLNIHKISLQTSWTFSLLFAASWQNCCFHWIFHIFRQNKKRGRNQHLARSVVTTLGALSLPFVMSQRSNFKNSRFYCHFLKNVKRNLWTFSAVWGVFF